MARAALLAFALVGCDTGGQTQTPDAKMIDASMNKVVEVTCPATPDATVGVSSGGGAYNPMSSTIAVNGIVRFVMDPSHDVAPNSIGGNIADPGLRVGFGGTKCLRFTEAGRYGFFCEAHSFAGTITVN